MQWYIEFFYNKEVLRNNGKQHDILDVIPYCNSIVQSLISTIMNLNTDKLTAFALENEKILINMSINNFNISPLCKIKQHLVLFGIKNFETCDNFYNALDETLLRHSFLQDYYKQLARIQWDFEREVFFFLKGYMNKQEFIYLIANTCNSYSKLILELPEGIEVQGC